MHPAPVPVPVPVPVLVLALVLVPACGTQQTTETSAAPIAPVAADPGPPPPPAACPRCVRIFDGKSWNGWVHDPRNWSIVGGAMRGFGRGARAAFTTADYGSFRLLVTSRMAPVNNDHLGILFWGPRPDPGNVAYNRNIQVQPPHGAMWDYFENRNLAREKVANGSRDFEKWNTTEVLANLPLGTVRMAVDGQEISRYQDRDRGRLWAGPIGMQKHGGGGSEYRDIFIEVDPAEDRLLTVAE
jgi:hypothetical protein